MSEPGSGVGDHDAQRRHQSAVDPSDERRHADAVQEEWLFAAWTDDLSLGVLSGHRVVNRTNWFWAAVSRAGQPLLHIAEFAAPVRSDPMIIKAEALWAEHVCDAPLEQWSIGNETYAVALEDPAEALGRTYGAPTPIAFDLEWYATGAAERFPDGPGYSQPGVVHGVIEIAGEPRAEVAEIPGARWHRWSPPGSAALPPLPLPEVVAHVGCRAPFRFPDTSVLDFVLTPTGWALRRSP